MTRGEKCLLKINIGNSYIFKSIANLEEMKIILYEFLALQDQEQYDVGFTQGQYLDIRIEEKNRFVLYAVEKFFVEVKYDSEKNKIINKTAFVTGEILDKYSSL